MCYTTNACCCFFKTIYRDIWHYSIVIVNQCMDVGSGSVGVQRSPWRSRSAPEITGAGCALLHPLPWIVLTAWWGANVKTSFFLNLTRKSVTRKQHDRRQPGSSALPPAWVQTQATRAPEAIVSRDAKESGGARERAWLRKGAMPEPCRVTSDSSLTIYIYTYIKNPIWKRSDVWILRGLADKVSPLKLIVFSF